MRHFGLICDYDGTIAHDGRCAPSTVEALKKVRASGRKLILATGRQLEELQEVFPEYAIFDRIVAENGAVLYRPASKDCKVLAVPPPPEFVDELWRRGVQPLSVGQCIVATWHPFESIVLEVIREQGLELQLIFNKNAVMVLPSGVNKASGLQVALDELRLSPHNSVGVGDAENDHVFLGMCECSVAVANALPALKERADLVTNGSHGAGVEELIEKLLADDLASVAPGLRRHDVLLGRTERGEDFSLDPNETQQPVKVKVEPAKAELRRHRRKYEAGELSEDKSFYFRGPEGKLNLRAQNMKIFAQLAEGVDEDTWTHHLRREDYSRWLREAVKDANIADEVAKIEKNSQLKPSESRTQILDAIRKHYTAPA